MVMTMDLCQCCQIAAMALWHGGFCANRHRLGRHIYLADFWLATIIHHPPSITVDLSDHVCDEAIQGPWVYELWLIEDIWVALQ